jgi:hypothetical protein
MLNAGQSIYWRLLNSVTQYLRIEPFEEYIPLPAVVLTKPFRTWVTPYVWSQRNVEDISHDVFTRVGRRPEAVLPLPADDNSPTRGLFITTNNIIRYEDIRWPMGIQPQVFLSMVCVQRVRHCHVAMVFNYYSTSPAHLCDALGIQCESCCRIKLKWKDVETYIQLQGRLLLSRVVNDDKGLLFEDHLRIHSLQRKVIVENISNGWGGFFNNRTHRRVWRLNTIPPHEIRITEITHVDHKEIYYSPTIGGGTLNYIGQFVVLAVPDEYSRINVPITAGVVVRLDPNVLGIN